MKTEISLSNKIPVHVNHDGMQNSVIITGASDGIGKALALEFASRGFSLGLIARREHLLEEVKNACIKNGASQVIITSVDVCDEKKFEDALGHLDEKLGGCTIFIANAGIGGSTLYQSGSWEAVKKTLNVNAMAAIHGLEIMKLKFISRGKGTLAGISSVAGARGLPTSGSYSASKAALTVHLESLRIELKPLGISVVTIAPGFILTEMTKNQKEKMPFLGTPEQSAKVFATGIIRKKKWIVHPTPFRFLYPILQILPRSIFDLIASKTLG